MDSIQSFFDGNYMPHGHCYLWQPHILWTHVLSDIIIAIAYFSIPVVVYKFAKARQDIKDSKVFVLFSTFIFCCGVTHLVAIYTIWHGIYGWHGLTKLTTAIVSLVTAAYVLKLYPVAVKVPTINRVKELNQQLEDKSLQLDQQSKHLQQVNVYRSAFDSLRQATLLLDAKHYVIDANQQALTTLGASASNLKGVNVFGGEIFILNENSIDLENAILAQSQHNIHNIRFEKALDIINKVGQSIRVNVDVQVVKDAVNDENYILLQFIPHQLKPTINQVESKEQTNVATWHWNIKDQFLSVSDNFKALTGTTDSSDNHQTIKLAQWLNHIHADSRKVVSNQLQVAIQSNQPIDLEYLGNLAGNNSCMFRLQATPVSESKNQATGFDGRIEKLNENSNATLDNKSYVLDGFRIDSSQFYWLLQTSDNRDYEFIASSQHAPLFNVLSQQESRKLTLLDFCPEVLSKEVYQHLYSALQQVATNTHTTSLVIKLPLRGEELWYQLRFIQLRQQATTDKVTLVLGHDISHQKQVELVTNHKAREYETTLNNCAIGIIILNTDSFKASYINQRALSVLGYSKSEFLAFPSITNMVPSNEQDKLINHLDKIKRGNIGDLYSRTYHINRNNGTQLSLEMFGCLIDKDHSSNKVLLSFYDITKLLSELEQLQSSNLLLEQFANVASHDLQEPLRKICLYSDSILSRLSDKKNIDNDTQFEVERLNDSATRMRLMIEDVLKLARLQDRKLTLHKTSLGDVLTQAKLLLDAQGYHEAVTLNADNFYYLFIDKPLFAQLFYQLLSNSIKFKQIDKQVLVSVTCQLNDEGLLITYTDNSQGFDAQYKEHIFDTFKRLVTREEASGNGIGLAICKKIVLEHSGKITVDSELGESVTFSITLPKKHLRYSSEHTANLQGAE
ncbi:hypothetical protein C2869_00775 [Saccharobesus litoralis]|uniref:histidine kinase n=1 Tax=Saccharobesus litoralis TaxID=2172099 RepID=A0A2S0VLH8_9ALTE|nr:ATP-binding protein [Saccharobesus litoralis]AWB65062.1 hypothetical protein C2869_00775 [Saccharobesus litoralis]